MREEKKITKCFSVIMLKRPLPWRKSLHTKTLVNYCKSAHLPLIFSITPHRCIYCSTSVLHNTAFVCYWPLSYSVNRRSCDIVHSEFSRLTDENIMNTCDWLPAAFAPPKKCSDAVSASPWQSTLRQSQVPPYHQMCCYPMPRLYLSWTLFYLWS